MMMEFVNQFCASARAAGIDRLNIYMEQRQSRDLSVYQGALEHLERSDLNQLFVEGLVDGQAGCVFIENFDEALIPDYIQAIRDTAAVCAAEFVPYCLEGLKHTDAAAGDFSDLDTTVEAMCRACTTAREADSRIDPGISAHLAETCKRITLGNEKQQFVTDVVSGGHYGISLVARDGELVQPGRGGKPFRLGDIPDLDELAHKAVEGAVSRLGSVSHGTGTYPVVLDARVMAELLDAFMPAFFARNVQSRMSVLAGKLGQQIGGENISIVEDPFMEDGFSTRNFDDEGIPTTAKTILDRGVLNCWLHNRSTAWNDGTVSGGNGFKSRFNDAVATGYTNVYIPKGELTRDELLEQMGSGLLITSVSGVFAGARPNSGDFSLISGGYRIEDGKIHHAVNQITIAGNFFEMLSNVKAIGSDEHWMIAENGNVRTPSVYVASLAISGKE